VICPGKSKQSGGWRRWLEALEHAAKVFGKGRVRSSIVAGLEPRESTLEGVEVLASLGVIAFPGPWIPNPGSALEGHRTPEASWHYQCVDAPKHAGRLDGVVRLGEAARDGRLVRVGVFADGRARFRATACASRCRAIGTPQDGPLVSTCEESFTTASEPPGILTESCREHARVVGGPVAFRGRCSRANPSESFESVVPTPTCTVSQYGLRIPRPDLHTAA
jgi:hypothetical protein